MLSVSKPLKPFLGILLLIVVAQTKQLGNNKSEVGSFASSILDQDQQENNPSVIAFSASRTKSLKGHKQDQYSLSFDHVLLNVGGYFDGDSGMFTAPVHGIYEFAFSGGALPHKKLSLQLMKNHFEIQTLAFDGHRKKNPRVQNQNILLELNEGERVWVKLAFSRQYGVVGASKLGHVTTFSGRLLPNRRKNELMTNFQTIRMMENNNLVPSTLLRSKRQVAQQHRRDRGQPPIAFSVAKTTSILGKTSNLTLNAYGRSGVISFDKNFVNTGSVMDLLSGEFTAPVKGIYFFSFTVGKYPRMKLSVSLVKNDNEFQVMVYDESLSNKRQMQSQSIILPLEEGDKMWLKQFDAPGYGVYSNLGNYITFSGYLLNSL